MAYFEAVSLSSGHFKQEIFDTPLSHGGLAHPYGYGPYGAAGLRGPIPFGDPAIINIQEGSFVSGWNIEAGLWEGDALIHDLTNESEHADNLETTDDKGNVTGNTHPLMIKRPIIERIGERIATFRIGRLEAAEARIQERINASEGS